ncbi:hypothetical protein NL676_014698 [Syzygium grande]|nr:hypothetical protein NL676_014698 [Syzygium grande]
MGTKKCQVKTTKYPSNTENEEGLSSCLRSLHLVSSSLHSFYRSSSSPSERSAKDGGGMRAATRGAIYTVHTANTSAKV